MKQNKPLKAKTPLKAKKPIKSNGAVRKTAKPHTISWYKTEARKFFNRAVKYRDSELIDGDWVFECITCPRKVLFRDRDGKFYKSANAGHFQPETRNNTRFNWLNVNGQCTVCNFQGLGEQIKYARALDYKYGDGTAKELERLAHIPHQFTIEELKDIIEEAKEEIRFYEERAKGNYKPSR